MSRLPLVHAGGLLRLFPTSTFGIGTARDMFDAIDRCEKNQGEYPDALYSYNVALARLDYAIGKDPDMP